ncbi:MAG: hypothetical protein A2W00_05125 [Candidatus Eisenbacteria bacterium RBG_16_71_46]|nr:MAG: hypothetical protein A2W00_05125 [Candidatus Eisenbacteria bacterium RBG_16_71_46]
MGLRASRPIPLLAVAACGAALACARADAAGPAVTVYSQNLAFVREVRTLTLGGSLDTLRLGDVPEAIDPTSITLAPAGGGRLVRLAYRFDLASGDRLLEAARGRRVEVVGRGDRATAGTLLAVDGAWLVVQGADGALHTLSRSAVEDVRLPGPGLGTSLRPTLEAVIEGARRGKVEVELSYLTGGLSWSAEHTLVRRGERAGVWSAAVTVENTSGRDFAEATLKLVAGSPSRAVPSSPRPMMMMIGEAKSSAPDLGEEAFSEYHLYTLRRPALLRDRESQRLSMIEPREIRLTPRYLYRGGDPRGVMSQLVVKNTSADGLGVPLPGGRVRIYEPDAGGTLQFTGETAIQHTPENETLTIDVGAAFDLAAERRQVSSRRISDREREWSAEIRLRNRKPGAVTVVVEENVPSDAEIVSRSHPFTRKDAQTVQFEVAVPAGAEATLSYTARTRS